MKKFNFVSFIFLLIIPSFTYAQYSNFDLARYKLPDIKLTRLDATFNLNNDYQSFKYRQSDSDNESNQSNNLQGSLNFDYYYFRNTEKYLGVINGIVNLDVHPNYSKTNDSKIDNKNLSSLFSLSNTSRFYNSNQNFLEIIPTISAQTNSYSSENTSNIGPMDNESTDYNSFYELSVPVSIGHGRIEPVEDLRLAIYILDELYKADRIDTLPPDNVVLDMAKEISKIKRKRFFDTRIMKIKELQVIDSFIVANKIVNQNDINYFAILNDQWDYASGPSRSAGFSANVGFDNQFNIYRSHGKSLSNGSITYDNKSGSNDYFLGGFFQVNYAKPINLCWQTSISLKTSYGIQLTRFPSFYNSFAQYQNYSSGVFKSKLVYIIQFIPNSRTSVSLNLSSDYYNSRGDRTMIDVYSFYTKFNNITLNGQLNMYYYVSPQFRIQVNSSFSDYITLILNTSSTQPKFKSTSNHLYQNMSLTLIYSFF